MRVVGFQNLSYVRQDTNVAIESYTGTLKAQLKSRKSRLVGHCVDWCIHELIGDVFIQYWYQSLCKNFGFVNKKCQHLMANFCHAQGNQAKVVAKLQTGLHNPIGPNLVLLQIKNGQQFNLK